MESMQSYMEKDKGKTFLSKLSIIILCVFLGWLWIVAGLYFLQRQIMYVPNTAKLPSPSKSYIEEIYLKTSDNLSLKSWYIAPNTDLDKVIVFFHGNAGNIENRLFKAEFFKKYGTGTLLVEYRGYGGNAGSPSEEGFYKDGRAAIEFLLNKKKIPLNRIILYGESIGSGTAVQMATEFSVSGLILEGAFTSAANIAKATYPIVPVNLLLKDRYDNDKKISKINDMPILLLHGKKDNVIPYFHSEILFELAKEPKKILLIDNGGHSDLYNYSKVLQAMVAFIKIN